MSPEHLSQWADGEPELRSSGGNLLANAPNLTQKERFFMSRNRSLLYRFRLPLKLFGVLLICGAMLAGALLLTKLGPQKVASGKVELEYDEAAGDALLLEIQRNEDEFRMLAEQRAPTEEDFATLEKAIDGLTEYIEMRGGVHSESRKRREALYDLRDELRGQVIYEKSMELERQAESTLEAGDTEEARRLLERALFMQRNLNEQYDRASYSDTRRMTRLNRRVEQLTAKPLHEQSLKAEADAEQAIAEEDFDRAKMLLAESIELQKQLNLKYRTLQYANVQRMAQLEQELASLKSSDIYERINQYREAGENAEADGEYSIAAEAYQNAFRLQRQLNKDFPQSRFAGVRLVEELQAKQENALSRDLGDGIKAEMALLDKAIRERTVWKAVEIIRALEPKVRQFTEQFPRSTILGDNALLKMQYLEAMQDDIGFLQDRIYGQLLFIDGVEGWRMLRTEVSQALYMSVMLKANPSRQVGDRLPVDSVNWDDASSFTQRVSWLLGHPVRLPNEDEFYAALGSLRYVNLAESSWNLENGGGKTHEIATRKPNGQGYYDLLGNVAEWLQSDSLPGEGEAYVAGGSVDTSVDQLMEKPVEISNRRMRNRFAGFRIVVNLPEDS